MINTKKCLICKGGRKNNCLHWHIDSESGEIWVWCQGICQRGYSIYSYCYHAGISVADLLSGEFEFHESTPNEVQKMEWPSWYLPLSDTRAKIGVDYVLSRGLTLEGDMYFDSERHGIVFPYYVDNHFVGAQTRFIKPWEDKDGEIHKIDTIPGTRLGLVFYGWNQGKFVGDVKGVFVTEGAFNSLSISQAFNKAYGGITKSPWRAIACSGSGATKHHTDTIKELKDVGMKIIVAPDSDEAGLKMLKKFKDAEAATHYALTGDPEKDWNDFLKELGPVEFAKFVLSKVKAI